MVCTNSISFFFHFDRVDYNQVRRKVWKSRGGASSNVRGINGTLVEIGLNFFRLTDLLKWGGGRVPPGSDNLAIFDVFWKHKQLRKSSQVEKTWDIYFWNIYLKLSFEAFCRSRGTSRITTYTFRLIEHIRDVWNCRKIRLVKCKVHIFWEGHKILRNFHPRFYCMYVVQSNLNCRFCENLWPSQNIWALSK